MFYTVKRYFICDGSMMQQVISRFPEEQQQAIRRHIDYKIRQPPERSYEEQLLYTYKSVFEKALEQLIPRKQFMEAMVEQKKKQEAA